jgi:ribonuclease III
MGQDRYHLLEDRLGHSFGDRNELERALTHPTFSKEEKDKNMGAKERPHQAIYATLGDAILRAEFVVLLMEQGLKTKGDITISKADWENNLKLAEVGERLQLLHENLILHRMGEGEEFQKGTIKLLSDTVEALIGAIFIDTNYNFESTKECIKKIFEPELHDMSMKYRL